MGGNVDDHIKNFSFLMERNGTWHITPAYDMTFTINLDGAAYENVHSMNIAGKDNGITEDDLLQFARQNGIKNVKRIIEEVSLAISTIMPPIIKSMTIGKTVSKNIFPVWYLRS